MLSNVTLRNPTFPAHLAKGDLGTRRFVVNGWHVRPDFLTRFRGGASRKQHQNKCVSHMASYKGEAIVVQTDGMYKCPN